MKERDSLLKQRKEKKKNLSRCNTECTNPLWSNFSSETKLFLKGFRGFSDLFRWELAERERKNQHILEKTVENNTFSPRDKTQPHSGRNEFRVANQCPPSRYHATDQSNRKSPTTIFRETLEIIEIVADGLPSRLGTKIPPVWFANFPTSPLAVDRGWWGEGRV